MTPTNTLTGPDLSAAVAVEVMGWMFASDLESWSAKPGHEVFRDEWKPYEDRNQAQQVIEEIKRRDLAEEMIDVLIDRIDRKESSYVMFEYLLTCPPSDICIAALMACREKLDA